MLKAMYYGPLSILENLLLLYLYVLYICILVFQINIFQFNSIQDLPLIGPTAVTSHAAVTNGARSIQISSQNIRIRR